MFIALDIGATNIRISSYKDLQTTTYDKKVVLPADDNQPYDLMLRHVSSVITELSNGISVKGIGVSMSGVIDPKRKIIKRTAAYPNWNGHKLSEDLGKQFGCMNAIEGDAVCAGLSEKFMGKGKDFDSMGFVIVGSGVGAVRIRQYQDKTLVYPTEFGHIPIIADGEKCNCGQRGCIQAYASGLALKAMYDQKAENVQNKEVWVVMSQHLTQALMSFLHMDYVETFIFGGGIAIHQDVFVDRLVKNIKTMLMDHFPKKIPILQKSAFLDDAGSIGSLILLRDDLHIINMNYL